MRSDYRVEALAIAHLLRRVGVEVNVEVWPDYGTLSDMYIREETRRQAWFDSWGNASLDPEGLFQPTLHTNTSGGIEGDGRGNFSPLFQVPEVDRLIRLTKSTFDPKERVAASKRSRRLFMRMRLKSSFIFPGAIRGQQLGWRIVSPSPDSRINLHRAVKK